MKTRWFLSLVGYVLGVLAISCVGTPMICSCKSSKKVAVKEEISVEETKSEKYSGNSEKRDSSAFAQSEARIDTASGEWLRVEFYPLTDSIGNQLVKAITTGKRNSSSRSATVSGTVAVSEEKSDTSRAVSSETKTEAKTSSKTQAKAGQSMSAWWWLLTLLLIPIAYYVYARRRGKI